MTGRSRARPHTHTHSHSNTRGTVCHLPPKGERISKSKVKAISFIVCSPRQSTGGSAFSSVASGIDSGGVDISRRKFCGESSRGEFRTEETVRNSTASLAISAESRSDPRQLSRDDVSGALHPPFTKTANFSKASSASSAKHIQNSRQVSGDIGT